MKWPAIGLVFAAALACHAAECKTGYKTTIVIRDSGGAPVQGADVELELNCGKGGKITRPTDSKGEAVFSYSLADLGEHIQFRLKGFATGGISKDDCTGPDKDKRCLVKLHF